ncbi:MAG: histidine phosphatase family protein [Desulfobacterales bacterium]
MNDVHPDSHTLISFVRHGRVHNPRKIVYGRLPRFRLSDHGLEEARLASRRLKDEPIAAVFSSPLLRARQTAREIAAQHVGIPTGISRLLNEVCTPFQGQPSAYADRVAWYLPEAAGCRFERPVDVADRVERFIRTVRRRFTGRHVVAVTHGDVIAFLFLRARGAELTPKNRLKMSDFGLPDRYPATGSVITLTFDGAKGAPGNSPRRIDYWRPDTSSRGSGFTGDRGTIGSEKQSR